MFPHSTAMTNDVTTAAAAGYNDNCQRNAKDLDGCKNTSMREMGRQVWEDGPSCGVPIFQNGTFFLPHPCIATNKDCMTGVTH